MTAVPTTPPPATRPVDIYVRVSRVGKRENLISPAEQERRARAHAASLGLQVGIVLTPRPAAVVASFWDGCEVVGALPARAPEPTPEQLAALAAGRRQYDGPSSVRTVALVCFAFRDGELPTSRRASGKPPP